MRTIATFLGVATFCTLASLASAQQLPKFNVGDSVDFNTSGKWIPCTVTAPLAAEAYGVRCGTSDMKAKNDPEQLRAHLTSVTLTAPAPDAKDEPVLGMAVGETIGARYGTREPRKCENSKADFSISDAKDLFICDSEHEFGGSLYLVSDVNLLVSTPRAFDATEDAAKTGIDPKEPVYDIRASYNNYQCSQIPYSALDYPGTRNCNEFKMSNAAGGCYKNTVGEWHCLMYDFHPGATATATNVRPPTLSE